MHIVATGAHHHVLEGALYSLRLARVGAHDLTAACGLVDVRHVHQPLVRHDVFDVAPRERGLRGLRGLRARISGQSAWSTTEGVDAERRVRQRV